MRTNKMLCVREIMTPSNQIVFKSLIGYGLFFLVIWLFLVGVLVFTGEANPSFKGLSISFCALQLPTLVLVIKTKVMLNKNPIK